MNITTDKSGSTLTVGVEGRLDALNARKLEAELQSSLDGVSKLIFDFSQLEYIASGGIRVLVAAQKVMGSKDNMTLRNVQPEILSILDMTGLTSVFDIE